MRTNPANKMSHAIFSDEALALGYSNSIQIQKASSIIQILQNRGLVAANRWPQAGISVSCDIDLHTTRNSYHISDSGEFRTIANFG